MKIQTVGCWDAAALTKPRELTAHEAAVARHRPKAEVEKAQRAFIGKAGHSRKSWAATPQTVLRFDV